MGTDNSSAGCRVPVAIPADHPCLAGHFPGQPTVPGVLLLDRVLAAAEEWSGPLPVTELPQVKFLAPLQPGIPAEAVLTREPGRLRFQVEQAGRVLARGLITLAPALLLLALLALALPQRAWSGTPDIDALLKQLARPAPATTPFLEVRFSRLLSRPLVVSGQMEYLGPDALARTVQQPFQEHTEIHGDEVVVQRGSAARQTFSLQRAPELRLLLSSFTALLAGDRGALERQFRVSGEGDAQRWTLRLTPLDARLRSRINSIEVQGAGGEPRCLTTAGANDALTVTLMGDAARVAPPKGLDRAWLESRCAG